MCIPNTEKWQTFFKHYKELPELWKSTSESFKNKASRDLGWLRLLETYKSIDSYATLDTLKRKIATIRSCYRREKRKIRESENSGANNIYIPSLWYFKHLEFLRDNEIGATETCNIEVVENEEWINNPVEQQFENQQFSQMKTINRNNILSNSLNYLKQENERDEALIFAEGWACLFRKLTGHQKLYAKKLIDEALFLAIQNKLSEDSIISTKIKEHQNDIIDDEIEINYKIEDELECNYYEDVNINCVEESFYTIEKYNNDKTEELKDSLEIDEFNHEIKTDDTSIRQQLNNEELNPLECRFCHRVFVKLIRKKDHERLHTGEKPYKCLHCDKKFRTSQLRTNHSKICNQGVNSVIKTEISNTQRISEFDGTINETINKTTKHMRPNKQEQQEHNDIRLNKRECKFCGRILGTTLRRKDHERLHTGETPYECPFCNKRFRTSQLRTNHSKRCGNNPEIFKKIELIENNLENDKINNDSDTDTENQIKQKEQQQNEERLDPRICKYCNKVFKKVFNRKNHERLHTGETPYQCQFCEALFRTSKLRTNHSKICDLNPDPTAKLIANIKRHKCDICSAEFKDKNNLVVHKFRHNGIKKFQCSFCEKRFVSSTERKSHERHHTNDRPFLCTACGKTFLTHSCYHRHIKRHTGEKLHQCTACDKAFITRTQLREHEITHSTERPFICDTCSSAFASKKRLKAHMKLHDEVGRYVCKICGKVFKQAAGLYGHTKSHHFNISFSI